MRSLTILLLAASALVLPAVETPAPIPTPVSATDRPFLGVQIDENATKCFDLDPSLPVQAVVPGSTAADIGILANDKIKTFNGQPIERIDDLRWALGKVKIGDIVTIELIRKGELKVVSGAIQGMPPGTIICTFPMPPMIEKLKQLEQALKEKQGK